MRKRYQLITLVLLGLYIAMIPLNSVIEREHREIFPFFTWSLFVHIPDWYTYEYGLIVHSIDGDELDRSYYAIPSTEIRDWKSLHSVARACKVVNDCDQGVTEIIYPILYKALGTTEMEFSIVEARIDLHDVQDNIEHIAAQEMGKTDLFRIHSVIGRWNTQVGRIT